MVSRRNLQNPSPTGARQPRCRVVRRSGPHRMGGEGGPGMGGPGVRRRGRVGGGEGEIRGGKGEGMELQGVRKARGGGNSVPGAWREPRISRRCRRAEIAPRFGKREKR